MATHKFLQDCAKVTVGLFIADILAVILLYTNNVIGSISFFGLVFTKASVMPIILFDIAIIILLIHYGWHINLPVKYFAERSLLMIVGVLLAFIALAHVLRIIVGAPIIVGSVSVPLWLSWIGALVTAYISYTSFHFAFKKK